MPITTGSNPMAMKPRGKKGMKKVTGPKSSKPKKLSAKKDGPTTKLDKLLKTPKY